MIKMKQEPQEYTITPSEHLNLLRPMQERIDELSKTQSEMTRMQREIMGVMLSLSLRLDSALESGARNQNATAPPASTAPGTRTFIDLSLDEVPNNKGKGKERATIVSDNHGPSNSAAGSSQRENGRVRTAKANKKVLKAVTSLSDRLDQVGKNVDSLLQSVSILERKASMPVHTPVPNPTPAPPRVFPVTESRTPVRTSFAIDGISLDDELPICTRTRAKTATSFSGTHVPDFEGMPIGTQSVTVSQHTGIAAKSPTSVATEPQGANENPRKRSRATFDEASSEDESDSDFPSPKWSLRRRTTLSFRARRFDTPDISQQNQSKPSTASSFHFGGSSAVYDKFDRPSE